MEFLLFHPVANRGSNGRVTAVVNQLATSMYAAVVDARRRDLSCINQTRREEVMACPAVEIIGKKIILLNGYKKCQEAWL